ncbi:MAG: DUF721 domain-containing protein [Verrucomicrobiota bacterium]
MSAEPTPPGQPGPAPNPAPGRATRRRKAPAKAAAPGPAPVPKPSAAPPTPGAAPKPLLAHEASKAIARAAQAARSTALTEWRGIDLRPKEIERRKADRPVADILGGVLQRLRIDHRQSESQVVAVWKQVIDPVVAAHARPVSLAKGTLFVSVDSSPWLAEIVRYRSKEILERLQLAVGRDVVQRVSYRIG